MLNLPEVDKATALMKEAINWSVMRWLSEKKRVRTAADMANDALDVRDAEVKASWSDELKAAYDELPPTPPCGTHAETLPARRPGKQKKVSIDSETRLLAKALKNADDEAYRAHMDAEDTFDRAERRLSTAMAREGSHKAILSWELREQAILKSLAAVSETKAAL
jgi:hypothetical protein